MDSHHENNNQQAQHNQAQKRDSDRVTWFRHNIDAWRGRRFQMLRIAGGYEAHGIYWALMEPLYKYGNRYPLANGRQKEALASELHITVEQLENTIKICIECENLLDLTDGILSCDRVEQELERACNISEKRRNAARLGGIAKGKQAAKRKIAKPATVRNVTVRNDTKDNKCALSSADFVFPSTLDNLKSKNALDDYIRHRAEIKKPVTRTQIEKVLKKYSSMPGDFVPNIEHSIANGWRGIHAPNTNDKAQDGPSADPRINTILKSVNKPEAA